MHIENLKHAIKGFQVRIVDPEGHTRLMLTNPNIQSARRAARALTVAYGNCAIEDKSGMKE
jgi:hypothetical protein